MIGLAAETAAAVFALWGLALWILGARARRADGVSRQWINCLADRSRKGNTGRKCRYSKAVGVKA